MGTFALGSKKRLIVNLYDDKIYVHIRLYETENGRTFPTKTGVAMTVPVFVALLANIEEIQIAVKALKSNDPNFNCLRLHLGDGIHCKIEKAYNCVDFRHYFIPEGKTTYAPTRRGIALNFREWAAFNEALDDIKKLIPNLPDCEFLARIYGRY